MANADRLAGLTDPSQALDSLEKLGVLGSQNERNGALGAAVGFLGGGVVSEALTKVARVSSGGRIGSTIGGSAALAARTRGLSIAAFTIGGFFFADELSSAQQKIEKANSDFRKAFEKSCRGG